MVLRGQVATPRLQPIGSAGAGNAVPVGTAGTLPLFLVTPATAAFDTVFAAAGIEVIKIPRQAPKANAHAERWVRTAGAECLDWVPIWNRRHLARVLTTYVEHYNTARPHRGIQLDVPVPSGQIDAHGDIEGLDILGGLIHEYRRAARATSGSS